MSIPGPPPNNGDVIAAHKEGYHLYTSDPSAPKDQRQTTLTQLADIADNRASRWAAVLMLRLVRLRLLGETIDEVALAKLANSRLAREFRAVLRVGRLSEVAIQLGCERIKANPEHIDIDWYGDNPGHWWNSNDFDGRDAELTATMGQLRFLEKSFGFDDFSNISPDQWQWPAEWKMPDGTAKGHWADLTANVPAPPFAPGFKELVFEWHYGANEKGFSYDSDGNRFWFETPVATRSDILVDL